MAELKPRVVMANGIRIHLVEAGEGPLVLMVHAGLDLRVCKPPDPGASVNQDSNSG